MSKFVLFTGGIFFISFFILGFVNRTINFVYMDEQFHYDQTINYLSENYYYWNPKLTTFPGLFIISAIFLWFLSIFNLVSNALNALRGMNTLYGFLFSVLMGNLKSYNTDDNTLLFQVIITILPINYFYNFLFYTDTISVLLVSLFMYANLNEGTFKRFTVFLIAMSSVLMRQNNIIWINLFFLKEILDFITMFKLNLESVTYKIKHLFLKFYHIAILDLLFICFIVWNKYSIVLGDKTSHEMVIHLSQLNHYLFFLLIFFPTLNLKILKIFTREFYTAKNLLLFVLLFILVLGIMLMFNNYSFTHDFILSDNRHYSFYYFKKIYLNITLRIAMITWTSIIFSLIIIDNFDLFNDNYILSVMICTTLLLVPAKLFEFRYFNLCYIVLLTIIHYYSAKWKDLYYLLFNKENAIWSFLINFITLFVFIKRPFNNRSFIGEESRFMW